LSPCRIFEGENKY